MRGEWDLNGGLMQVRLPGSKEGPSSAFSLVQTQDPLFLRAGEVEGWYELEQNARSGERWRWTKDVMTALIENPNQYPLLTTWHIQKVSSLQNRDFQMNLAGQPLDMMRTEVGKGLTRHSGAQCTYSTGEDIGAIQYFIAFHPRQQRRHAPTGFPHSWHSDRGAPRYREWHVARWRIGLCLAQVEIGQTLGSPLMCVHVHLALTFIIPLYNSATTIRTLVGDD